MAREELGYIPFYKGITLLQGFWKEILNETRLPRYYEAVKLLSEKEFGLVCDELLDTHKGNYAPTPAEFKKSANQFIRAVDDWDDPTAGQADPRDGQGLDVFLKNNGTADLVGALEKARLKYSLKGEEK